MKTKKKLTPPKKPEFKIYLEIKETTVHESYEGGRYGSWEKTYDCAITKAVKNRELLSGWNTHEFSVDESVFNASSIFVVYVKHTDGDSFGQWSGNLSIAWVTSDANEAIKVKNIIEEEDKRQKEERWQRHGSKQKNKTDTGWTTISEKVGYPSWWGYFNRVENVGIEILTLY